MKKQKKNKEIKQQTIKYVNEDTDQIRKFILILIGVALITGLLYFVTAKYLIKDDFQEENTTKEEVTIAYDTIKAGNVFNRPYDKYYVFAYDPTLAKASYYATLISNYDNDEIKMYFLDMSLDVNKKYSGEEGNAKATVPSELSLTEVTLMLIENGKITKYYENIDDIANIIG